MPTIESMSTAFEERQTSLMQTSALEEVKEEYKKHFDAVAKPPRLLVGQEVPSLTGDGMERLRDSNDARDWQEAVKQLLLQEVESRVETRRSDSSSVFATVHSSIDLFKGNPDLIPGTKGFDRELADSVAKQLEPYAAKTNGKLIGYSVPVQPIVTAVRAQLVAQRSAKPAPAAAPQARTPDGRWDGPQGGIRSKAGSSGSGGSGEGQGLLDAFARQNGVRF